jgi:predicted enzyme related to lactoylglutathione lyase
MLIPDTPEPGRFCWLDLAATDALQARRFYAQVFGWQARDQAANGGHFTRLQRGNQDAGSLYQLAREQVARHVPSHWTPYIAVADVTETLRLAEQAGGRTIVSPVAIEGMAVIAVIEDAVGALVGLWQALPDGAAPGRHDVAPGPWTP